ncbi:NADH-quinone oxidoreductase subunit L, partial [Brevundimonas sp.]|uniref:NADH-quinone oxidoreductase subunit L n=1 Tax=Brevundimonas sp. TaxID=1871086 RepID=UPI0025FE5FF0
METLVTIGVFAPLIGAMIAGLTGRRIGDTASMAVTTGLLFLSCAIGWYVFSQHTWGGLEAFTLRLLPFINIGDFQSAWSIRIDALSAVMLIVVTTVSALVHLYSWGYMAEDPDKPRFFAYLSLFTFAMLALVTAADFMQLFFGWEGVGLASYLLIGFWFKKPTASAAAIKAFVVNRVGDFGFALGIMTVFWMFGTIEFAELFPLIEARAGATWEFLGYNWSALDLAGFLLFIGAMGKSAQFFLHTWLPDAMEGPTPVSALIHAATMVTAGVYMVCLLSPIYEYAPVAAQIIAVTGAVTALFAATVGLAQNDIKRVIAYSTCSQLGYMFFAAGVGAYLVLGHLDFDGAFHAVADHADDTMRFLSWDLHALTVVTLLLFMGAMGKSAQFLLHTWLPDAMEGPTPVSALIHAATMVTAGVFMVARLSPLFETSTVALTVVIVIGAITAFFAATVGLVQNDIKRVIAYSTCSQLGYMFVALGVGAYSAGIFHLFTHAFFKALLFLGAGSVIHAMHHEQDMRNMGGLAKKIPITYAMMMIGTLALTGVGIPGTNFGFAGFFSKDAIIESAYAYGGNV